MIGAEPFLGRTFLPSYSLQAPQVPSSKDLTLLGTPGCFHPDSGGLQSVELASLASEVKEERPSPFIGLQCIFPAGPIFIFEQQGWQLPHLVSK